MPETLPRRDASVYGHRRGATCGIAPAFPERVGAGVAAQVIAVAAGHVPRAVIGGRAAPSAIDAARVLVVVASDVGPGARGRGQDGGHRTRRKQAHEEQ
jgi:hypothetical protein